MAYASKVGRAKVSSSNPMALAVCDRCGIWHNFVDLSWQFDWRGPMLQNLRLLVCRRCKDIPQEQLRSIVLPPDPQPIINARPEFFQNDEAANFPSPTGQTDPTTGIPILSFGTTITSGTNPQTTITYQPIGNPTGLEINAQAPLVKNIAWGVTLPVLSVQALGTTTIQVTCSSPHNLSTNAQVGVEGLVVPLGNGACGIFSITVTSATAFTYTVYSAIAAGSLLTNTTLIKTANVGLPYGVTQVPVISP